MHRLNTQSISVIIFFVFGQKGLNSFVRTRSPVITERFSFTSYNLEICEYLTDITKFEVREHSELDEQGTKVTDFFAKTEEMYEEMKWQKKLRSSPALFWVSGKSLTWKNITLICMMFINIILALYYPYRYEFPSRVKFCFINIAFLLSECSKSSLI